MSTTYLDTFTGDGALNGHAADSGFGTWTLGAETGLTISGGKIALTLDGVNDKENLAGSVVAAYTESADAYVDMMVPAAAATNIFWAVYGSSGGSGYFSGFIFGLDVGYSGPTLYWDLYALDGYLYYEGTSPSGMTLGSTFRFGCYHDVAAGTVRLYSEPYGGGTRTWLSTAQVTSATFSSGTAPKLWVSCEDATTGGYIDNLTIVTTDLAAPADVTTSTVALSTDYSDSGAAKFYIGRVTTLTLTANDANGDPVGAGGETVAIDHAGGTSDLTISAVTDVGDGTYTATITALTAGTSTAITVTIGGVTVTTTMPSFTVLATPTVTGRGAQGLRGAALVYTDTATVTKWSEARQYALRFGLAAAGRWHRFAVVHGATATASTSDVNYFALYAMLAKAVPAKQRTDTF